MDSFIFLLSFVAGWFVCWVQHNGAKTQQDLIQVSCSKCAGSITTTEKNLRTPFYCSMCK